MRTPVAGRLVAFEQAGRAQHQGAGADAHDPSGAARLLREKRQGLLVLQQRCDAGAARHDDHVELAAVFIGGGGAKLPAQLRLERVGVLPHKVQRRTGNAHQQVGWCNIVDGGDVGKHKHADVHGGGPRGLR
ncbi:hypothetical protein D3C71_1760330 [compost metagenome]